MKVITKDKQLQDDFAILLELTDEDVANIKKDPQQILTLDKMQQFVQSKGNNAHIIQLTLQTDISIRLYTSFLLSRYKTVSWFNREHKFYIIGEKRCLH